MTIQIRTGDFEKAYEAENSKEAIRLFFRELLYDKVDCDRLGLLGEWFNGTEWIPFRIVPALYKAGKLSADNLRGSLTGAGLDFSPEELAVMVEEDAWMVEGAA